MARSDQSESVHAHCVRCGYMFIKTPGLPPVPCRCGAMLKVASGEGEVGGA
jgi:hypothetical protein